MDTIIERLRLESALNVAKEAALYLPGLKAGVSREF